MKLKSLLTPLLRQDAPPDEENAPQETQSSEEPPNVGVSEKESEELPAADADGAVEEDLDLEAEEDHDQEAEREVQPQRPRHKFSRVVSYVFPSPDTEDEIRAYVPHYRHMPILSGIFIPLAILLDIPGLTERWYVHTSGATIVSSKPNPPLLVAGLASSIGFAVLANICIVVRFLERRIFAMTILCITFLSLHDILNIVALGAFGATKDHYNFSQAFWMTLCSTIVSSFVNLTLIIDFIRIPDFKRSGSGLTRRQRSLVIIIIGLLCYIGLGALVNALLLHLSFINGLYFTVVTIETIGFGDIVPNTPGSRVFVCIYATLGIINVAFVVGYFRETVLEGLDFSYRRRILAIQERRRAARRRRRAENRWRHAIVWRLRARQARIWIPEKATNGDQPTFWSKLKFRFWRFIWRIRTRTFRRTHMTHCFHGMVLNLKALPQHELEAAALEAGVPLDTLLPPDFYEVYDQDSSLQQGDAERHSFPWWFVRHPVYHHEAPVPEPLTHIRLGAMAAMVTKVALAVIEPGADIGQTGQPSDADQTSMTIRPDTSSIGSSPSSSTEEMERDYRTIVVETEKHAHYIRIVLSWAWFLTFWMGGAGIFTATEGWSYGSSVYFCFIAFTTIGYGDLAPTTPAGRSIFVVWALVGVATMTIFFSVIAEAYSTRYKNILGRTSFKKAVKRYRERTRAGVQETASMTAVRFHPEEIVHPREEVTKAEPQPPSGITEEAAAAPAGEAATQELREARGRAQTLLEQLPGVILTEGRAIQQYIQLIGDREGRLEVERYVDERIWNLMDEIVDSKRLTECTKVEILKDREARQTLVLLGMERSIQDLVSLVDQALVAVQERDRIIASMEPEREGDESDESDSDEEEGSPD